MRDQPFQTLEELDAYVSGPRIECLECGRWFRALATHLPRTHGMTHNDYREKWGIPQRYPLAGTTTRNVLSNQLKDLIAAGRVTHDHLDTAVAKAQTAGRRAKKPVDAAKQRTRTRENRPGDHHRLPPGAKRADGKDADRTREYQIAYRAAKAGDPEPMRRYRLKYQTD